MNGDEPIVGVSLRDEIAIHAMQALINTSPLRVEATEGEIVIDRERIAREAYAYADIMLRTRGVLASSRYGKKRNVVTAET